MTTERSAGLSRRTLLRRMACVALGSSAGTACLAERSSAAAAARPRERTNILYALSTGSWSRVVPAGRPLPLLTILDETASTGFNGVRLTPFPQILEQNGLTEDGYARELEDRGLRFSTISFGGEYLEPAGQAETLVKAQRVLAVHRRFGADAAIFFPPGTVPPSEEREALSKACRFFNRMGKIAVDEYGVRMGLHNHTGSLVETPRQVDQFLNETDPRYVFCAWDTGHLLLGGCDVTATFAASLDRIVYIDFKDAVRTPVLTDYVAPNGERYAGDKPDGRFFNSVQDLGRGEIDFPKLMELLKGSGYQGWINHDLDTVRVSCVESWRIAMQYIEQRLDPIYQ